MVRRRAGRAAQQDRARRLKKRLVAGWTADKVRALSNEVILERLAGFGIAASANEVVEQARAEHDDMPFEFDAERLEAKVRRDF